VSYQKISFEIKNNIAYLGLGLNEEKSMTTLSEQTLKELMDVMSQIEQLSSKKEIEGLIIHSHKAGCFLAGVDVTLIAGLDSYEKAIAGCEAGQGIYNRIEDLPIPSMALVDGLCLGGGTELALACTKIMVSTSPKTAMGLPEVMLGVLPGFGGTYRMPKKIGLPAALDLILTGKQCRGKKLIKSGLAEYMVPSERMLELAPEFLKMKDKKNKTFKESLAEMAADNFIARKVIFQKAREQVLNTTKGFYPAPLKILELLEAGAGKSRDTYMQMEAHAFAELSQGEQSKSLQHIFFMQDKAKKLFKDGSTIDINRGAVLGAGTMGGGIAWLFAENNQAPLMKDIGKAGLELGLKQASAIFAKDFKRKKITEDEFDRKIRSIVPTTEFAGFGKVDLVVEAVVENMDVKKKVFTELEGHVSGNCLITSNSSSLSISEMAKALKKPERFAGLHFFNPVNKMPLVEIIKHKTTSDETIRSLYQWCLQVKKTPIVVGDGPGFLVNRILAPFLNEAAYLLSEGVSIEDLDQAVLNFGMPMGAARLMDEIGLDVCAKVGHIMESELGERMRACELSKHIVEAGFLGKKASKGFYLYDADGKQTSVNPEIQALLPSKKVSMDETTIQMRVFLPMINEAANILQDGITDSAETVDIGLIFGLGFPPFKGGLLKYADREGLSRIGEAIEKFSQDVNAQRYAISPYLKELVAANKNFYS
jgi:3-hydroxyacyl-CoA dehydrogenase / enoyl-CoA hydratase / 3-hydroxybutyryl-CoA epimerase